jgi:hypothetical protein
MIVLNFLFLLALLAVWVSMPLFPAVLIYRRFPNTPLVASGPLAGLTINTGGAFAAYLIILLIVTPLVNTAKDLIGGSMRPYWEIRGEVSLVDETGKEIQALDQVLVGMRLQTRPDILGHDGNTLRLKIPEESEGRLPQIVISFPESKNWGSQKLEFDEQTPPWWKFWGHTATRDNFHKTIDVGKIAIRALPRPQTYNSTSPMDK